MNSQVPLPFFLRPLGPAYPPAESNHPPTWSDATAKRSYAACRRLNHTSTRCWRKTDPTLSSIFPHLLSRPQNTADPPSLASRSPILNRNLKWMCPAATLALGCHASACWQKAFACRCRTGFSFAERAPPSLLRTTRSLPCGGQKCVWYAL